jgi:hypothetical protein
MKSKDEKAAEKKGRSEARLKARNGDVVIERKAASRH